jgi:RNA polymerase sigma factor (sigma-70 family)
MSDHDDRAFEAWARPRLASLLRFGFAITHDEGAAEKLVESALMRTALAWRDLSELDAERYARRVMVAGQQRAWRRPRRRVGVTAARFDPPAAAPAPDVVDLVAEPQDEQEAELVARDRVWRDLVDLPPRQRAVLVLRCYERRPAREVAEVLACTVETVERDERDALASLGART